MEQTGATVQLSVLDDQSVLYIYRIESRRAIRMGFGSVPVRLHCTALGKACSHSSRGIHRGSHCERPAPPHAGDAHPPAALRQELAAFVPAAMQSKTRN